MDFSPTQNRQIKQLWQNFTSLAPKPNNHADENNKNNTLQKTKNIILNPTSQTALWQIIALNTGVFIYTTTSIQQTSLRAVERHTQTWLHSATQLINTEYSQRMQTEIRTSARLNAQSAIFTKWALSLTRRGAKGDAQKRWWTFITKAFVHADLQHFVGNVSALYTFGTSLSRVAGIKGVDVWVLAIGSSFVGSVATLANCRFWADDHSHGWAMGASGVVNAYMAVTALGSVDDDGFDVVPAKDVLSATSIPTGLIVGLNIAYDVALWTAQIWAWDLMLPKELRRLAFGGEYRRTNAVAHLAGAAFGAAYYYFILKPRAQDADRRGPKQSNALGRTLQNDISKRHDG